MKYISKAMFKCMGTISSSQCDFRSSESRTGENKIKIKALNQMRATACLFLNLKLHHYVRYERKGCPEASGNNAEICIFRLAYL